MSKLKQQFESVVDRYIRAFCAKHDFDVDYGSWIADDKGGIYENADYFFGLEDIRYDIDNNLPEPMILEWYNATLDNYYVDKDYQMNLYSWHKGLRYPKPLTRKEKVLKWLKRPFKWLHNRFILQRKLNKMIMEVLDRTK